MESLIFVVEKKDGRIKGRGFAIGSTQRSCTPKEEAISTAVATESVLITGVIDAKQESDIMSLDVPNSFVQTPIPPSNERTTMKFRGRLVNFMLEMNDEKHAHFIHDAKNREILCVRIMKIYMLNA